MAGHVYHWKHGWIPLDHAAALSKAKGDKKRAERMLGDAKSPAAGIHSRRDVAGAINDLSSVPAGERSGPRLQIADGARRHGAEDLLPASLKPTAGDGGGKSVQQMSDAELRAAVGAGASAERGEDIHVSQRRGHITADQARSRMEKAGAARVLGKQASNEIARRAQSRPTLDPGLVRDLRGGSAERHLVAGPDGTRFSSEREALHRQIIDQIVGGHTAQEHPSFVMLGGGPASGKTKAAEAAARDFPDAVKVDPDEIKKMLPEYAKMSPEQAAAHVHEESSYLAKRVTEEALKRRAHVVLDAVGDSSVESVRGKIGKARTAGYSVHARYVTVPIPVAQERARLRGIRSGRVVPPAVIEQSHRGVSHVFPEVVHEFDSAALYDNTDQWKLVLEKFRGQPAIVHELGLWRSFVRKRGSVD